MLLDGIRAVAFDAVGTLIHPDPPVAQVYAEVGRRHGSLLSAAEVEGRFRNAVAGWHPPLSRPGQVLSTSDEQERRLWRLIVGVTLVDVGWPDACFEELFAHFGRPEAWRVDEDAPAVLDYLSERGLVLALASNFDQRLHQVAARPELRPISHIVISSEVGWRKPARQFFTALCDRLQLPAGQILLVGDDLDNDFHGARSAGMPAVLLDPRGRHEGVSPRITRLADLLES